MRDLGSRNGTFVNGNKVSAAVLHAGDELRLGGDGPRFRVDAADGGAAAVETSAPQRRVGHTTLTLMIDRAVEARSQLATRGLRVAVVTLSALVVVAGAVIALLVLRQDDEGARAARNDAASAGSRIAVANEGSVFLLAFARPGAARPEGFCTAFAVSPDLLATNAHCVLAANEERARGARVVALQNKAPGRVLGATPVYLDARFHDARYSRGGSGYDVGLLRVDAPLTSRVRLATEAELFALHEGDAIFVYGFPGMTMNEGSPVATITVGLLNRVTDFSDGVAAPAAAQKLLHSAQTAGGSSGSPMFLPSGSAIGVNAGSLADDERQIVVDPVSGQRREVEVSRGSNFKYGMRADLIRQAVASVGESVP